MRRTVALLISVMVLALAACGDDDSSSEADQATTTSTTTTTAPAGDGGSALSQAVISEAPAGFRELTADDGFATGDFDIDKFITDFSTAESEDRAILTDNGLQGGTVRGWVNQEQVAIAVIFGFEFRDASAAVKARDALDQQSVKHQQGKPFAVSEIDGATGMRSVETTMEGEQHTQMVSFTRGARLFAVGVITAKADSPSETVLDFARRQSEHAA